MGVQFDFHEYERRHEILLPIKHKNYNFRKQKNSQVVKVRENNKLSHNILSDSYLVSVLVENRSLSN